MSDADLQRLLDLACNSTMTPEEVAAQRESWVRGQMASEEPHVTLVKLPEEQR